jgi:ribonuclease J
MKDNEYIRIISLGGCGEIGKNMMVIEYADTILIVDAGMMFPEEHMPGIDFIIPDISYVADNRHKVKAIILTHGHEDHIGALPYLLKEVNPPIYGTKLTLGFAKNRLDELSLPFEPHYIEIVPRQKLSFGKVTAEFFRVCHSIADGVGIAFHTPYGIIIHSGDFKFDFTPIHDHHFDFFKIAEYGERGVLLMMSDSTNAENKGYTPSERELSSPLSDAICGSERRVIVATFASNIHRIQQIFDVCHKAGKKIAVFGKSLEKNILMAKNYGYLEYDQNVLISPERVKGYPRDKIVILTTGSQGEPMSALSRIVQNTHNLLQIENGDTVILSASIIPGNEKTVSRIVNSLFRKGANVIYEGFEDLHVSGHASREELKLLLAITKPEYFMPIHGEFKHLVHHSNIAKTMGIDENNIILAQNGDVVTVNDRGIAISGKVDVANIYIDGRDGGDIEGTVLKERNRLAEDGIVLVVFSLSIEDKGLMYPEIFAKGIIDEQVGEDLLNRAKDVVFKEVRNHLRGGVIERDVLKEAVRSVLKSYFRKEISRLPIILPVIIEV